MDVTRREKEEKCKVSIKMNTEWQTNEKHCSSSFLGAIEKIQNKNS